MLTKPPMSTVPSTAVGGAQLGNPDERPKPFSPPRPAMTAPKPAGIKLNLDRQPPTTLSPRSLLIYGPPKVGKTFAAAQLEGNFIVEVEPGASMHECMRQEVSSYADLVSLIKQLRAHPQRPKYVTFDTIDAIEDMCRDEATLRYKKSSLVAQGYNGDDVCTDLPMGAGYMWLRNVLKELMADVLQCADHVILVGHVRDKFIMDRVGKEAISKDLDLTGKCANIVCGMVDAVGHMTRRARDKKHPSDPTIEDLWISFKTSETVNCGARNDHIKGREFILLSHEDRKAKWNEIYID